MPVQICIRYRTEGKGREAGQVLAVRSDPWEALQWGRLDWLDPCGIVRITDRDYDDPDILAMYDNHYIEKDNKGKVTFENRRRIKINLSALTPATLAKIMSPTLEDVTWAELQPGYRDVLNEKLQSEGKPQRAKNARKAEADKKVDKAKFMAVLHGQ